MEPNRGGVFVIIAIAIIIVITVLIFVFRDTVFTKGHKLAQKSNKDLSNNGYGTYSTKTTGPCVTSDGKCSSAGIQKITQFCEPNPITKKGCLDADGNMTFDAQVINQVCQPNCRNLILNEVFNPDTICQYDPPYNLPAYNCITPNAQSYFYQKHVCVKNDPTGDNTCTYKCGSAGVDSTGLHGDADVNKLSYIPACAKTPTATIKLNSLAGNVIFPTTGFLMSKGYTVYNIKNLDGTVNTESFQISPAYPPWNPANASNIISRKELEELDLTFEIYNNCIMTGSSSKPFCDSYSYFRPATTDSFGETGVYFTSNPNQSFCQLDSGFSPIKDCYLTPWYLPLASVKKGDTGLQFFNPYTGSTGYSGVTGHDYTWQNIGNYGYISSALSCLPQGQQLSPKLSNGLYRIIPSDQTGVNGAICLNLQAPPGLCASGYENIFSVPQNLSINSLIQAYEGNTGYVQPPLTSYPAAPGSTNYMCVTQFPNGIKETDSQGNPVPGCVQTCRYIPDFNDINFKVPDNNGQILNPAFIPLIGKYLTFKYLSSNQTYFMTLQNTPCDSGEQSGFTGPLGYCNAKTSTLDPTPVMFVYDGGDGVAGGSYWGKNNCDTEAITLTTSLQVTVSPQSVVEGGFLGQPAIFCTLYANFGNFYGYISNGNNSAGAINVGNYSNLSNFFGIGNIIANQLTNINISFVTLSKGPGTVIPQSASDATFILTYDSSNSSYTLYPYPYYSDAVTSQTYNGNTNITQLPGTFQFSQTPSNGNIYFTTEPFGTDIYKTNGLYAGQNVNKSINMQRKNPCYTQRSCEINNPDQTCFPNTCNLFYEYTPDLCG